MKKITPLKSLAFLIACFCAVNLGFGQMSDLIISEYGEGSGNNKYIEIFNGTGSNVDLTDYQIWRVSNGGTWPEAIINLSGILTNGSSYLIANGSANATILAVADLINGNASWNGNDAAGLAKDNGAGTFFLIDAVGTDGADPGSGWDVAGTTNATTDHTLIRKTSICTTNTNWTTSAGTTTADSEWIVLGIDNWSDIGSHTTNCCIYTSTWTAGSWSPSAPTINSSVTIADNYNTFTNGSFSACTLTVNNNSILTVDDNTYIEIQNDITVDSGSSIIVQPQGTVVQINDSGSVTNNGTMTVTKTTAPANAWYEYTHWSSPVSGADIANGLSEAQGDRRFVFNAQNFLDETAETANNGAALPGQDGIDDDANDWQPVGDSTIMTPGVGYVSTHDQVLFSIGPGNQFDYTFDGPFNNGIINVPIYRNDSETADTNWNLVGNPYPSAIDADLFLAANSNIAIDVNGTSYLGTGYTNGAIFIWSQDTPPSDSANGNEVLNFSNNDYAIINAVGQNSGGDGVLPSRYIPSGQGFFISMANAPTPATLVTGDVYTADIVFNNSMRVKGATDNSQFFKNSNTKGKSNTVVSNKLWLNLTSDNGVFNQILVGYVNGATNNDDGIAFDTDKYTLKGASLYTTINGSDKKFAIQGKAVNSLNEEETIKLGFKTFIDVATLYKLSIADFQGDFLTSNTIYLKDNLLNKLHDLSTSDYSFTSEVGEFNSRFEIVFNANALSTDVNTLDTKSLRIVDLGKNQVQFNTSNNLSIKAVNIFDLLGRQLYSLKGSSNSETYSLSKFNSAIYIAKVELSNGAIITKKAIKK